MNTNAAVATMENQFAGGGSSVVATRPTGGNALVDVESQRAMAEVQGAIVLAKKFPRDQKEAFDRIMVACQREGLARAALYSYSRGGSDVTGPSIRLAEAIAQNWGNIQFGIQELEQRNGESTVKAYAWDVETNTKQEKIFQVAHKRHTKKGSYQLEDPRDIYEMVANQGARRLRACILGVIPGDVIESAVEQCEGTLKAKADTSPAALQKLVEAFAAMGVTKDLIEARIQRHIDAMTAAQLVSMRKIYNSLKDGMSTVADWFEASSEQPTITPSENKGAAGLKNKLKITQPAPAAPSAATGHPPTASPDDLDQIVYRMLADLAALRAETPDDVLFTLGGKATCQADIGGLSIPELEALRKRLDDEIAKEA